MGKPLWPSWYQPPASDVTFSKDVLLIVCKAFGIGLDAMISKDRSQNLAHARSVAAVALFERGLSKRQIGRRLGGRDHTTIRHALEMFPIYAKHNSLVSEAYAKVLLS
jgi:chromosomal replication initiation ATPase DnaA